MKKSKKLLSFLLAFAMLLAVFSPAIVYAADDSTETVTLHKILMSREDLNAEKDGKALFPGTKGKDGDNYVGNQINSITGFFGSSAKEINGVYFALKFAEDYADEDHPDFHGKYVKADSSDPLAPANPLAATDNVNEAVGGLTTDGTVVFKTSALSGNFEIVEETKKSSYESESDGKILADSKAVPVLITLPLVNNEGVVKNAHVYPKNTEEKPEIDKNFEKNHGLTEVIAEGQATNNTLNAGADYKNSTVEKAKVTAEVGTVIPYEVKTKVNAGSRYKRLKWNDSMSNGLTLLPDTIAITARYKTGTEATETSLDLVKDTDYKIVSDDRGFSLYLTDAGIEKGIGITNPEEGEGKDLEFILSYSAKVNKSASPDNPETNEILLEYSNNAKSEQDPKKTVTPQDNEIKLAKSWMKGESPITVKGHPVVYILSQSGVTNPIEVAVSLNGNEENNTVFDLDHDIKFEVTGDYQGTFKGLPEGGTWELTERVSGYDVTINGDSPGNAAISNSKDTANPSPLKPTSPKIENYGKKFVKADKKDGSRLEGAEFVIRKGDSADSYKYLALKDINTTEGVGKGLKDAKDAYTKVIDDWYKAVENNPDKSVEEIAITIGEEEVTGETAVKENIGKLKKDYDEAYYKAANAYEWVDSKEAANVVSLISDVGGKFEITGLEKGNYTLVETKAPAGYALPTNAEFPFTVESNSYTSGTVSYEGTGPVSEEATTKDALRIDNKKVSIPATGGRGTIIFTLVGIGIMIVAIVAYKKNKKENEA